MVAGQSNFCPYCGAAQHGEQAAVYNQALQATPQQPVQADPEAALLREYPLAKTNVGKQHLAPRAIVAFVLAYIGRTSLILLLLVASIYFDPLLAGTGFVSYGIILLLIALLAWSNFYYCVDDTSFQKQHGIFHKYNVTIPFSQIQNVNISRSIIDQLLGLARIDIETAGDADTAQRSVIGGSLSQAEGHLPGVTIAQAKRLHDILLQKAAVAQK